MNEMIPKPNTVPAEAPPEALEEVNFDPERFIITKELAPSVQSLEEIEIALSAEIDAAADYPAVISIFEAAIAKNGHQTVETIILSRFNNEPTEANKVYLDLIKGISESETILAAESYNDPAFEGMSKLFEMVSNYTEEEIRMVTDITDPTEAMASPERKRMKEDIAPLYKMAVNLRWSSTVVLDTDRTKYPEFWQIFDKFEAIHQAIGIINTIQKTVRHNCTVK